MPIIIDTSAGNLDDQIKKMSANLALTKQVDGKFFSKALTGNGIRANGLLSKDSDKINDQIFENRKKLTDVRVNEIKSRSEEYYNRDTFGNQFERSTKKDGKHFESFENNLTTMVPPIILQNLIDDSVAMAITVPKNTHLYNIKNLESRWIEITSGTIDGAAATVYALPVIQSVKLYSKKITAGSGLKTIVSMQPDIYIAVATVLDDMDENGNITFTNRRVGSNNSVKVDDSQGVASIYPLYETNRKEYDYGGLESSINGHINNLVGNTNISIQNVNMSDLYDDLGEVSVAKTLERQAMCIAHKSDKVLLMMTDTLSTLVEKYQTTSGTSKTTVDGTVRALTTFVQHIDLLNDMEDDLVTTDLLAAMFDILQNNISDVKTVSSVSKHSLRLLLSQRLHELDEIRNNDGLYKFEPKDTQVQQNMENCPDYSTQQKKIVGTTDPLVIGQAGAGSGKTHTLIGRINYLKAQGEDLTKTLVLSFTNVSAINVTNRFPEVRSETLANMFHTIYSATYPVQSLSQPSTVANSIELLNPRSDYFTNLGLDGNKLKDFIHEFAIRLGQFDTTGFKRVDLQQELKLMANLIEDNLDMTIHVLNAVEQTTLELEPIIIHHMLLLDANSLNIPQEYQDLEYIITDESQDISTFEYILLLELTIHYRSQLLIIGDGSQTLYEFRNSDPRYMNALESSNVFTSHKLETNYRSNEEILMFANQFLQIIDANKYAKIQLQSATFTTPTDDTIRELIKIDDVEISGGTVIDYSNNLKEYLTEDSGFKNWFLEKVRAGEQVALMGWTRKEVISAGEALEEILAANGQGHIEVTNIMSDNKRPLIILSRFARYKCETLRSLDPTNPNYVDEIKRHVSSFLHSKYAKSSSKQQYFYESFIGNSVTEITNTSEWKAWLYDYRAGHVNKHQIGSYMIQQMLRTETRKNATDQYLNKQKEVPNYDECPVIISTIHGTKGLEFDHTIVVFNEGKNNSTSQESLRMMFVALTRSKKSEFIVNAIKPNPNRMVSNTRSGMFETPINTAFTRTIDDVNKIVV